MSTHQTAIEKAQAAVRAMRDAGIVPERLTPIEKAKRNPKSLRLAVTAFCWSCVGGNRNDVRSCTATECPLYALRPYQSKEAGE